MDRSLLSIGPVLVTISAAAWFGPAGCGGGVHVDGAASAGAGGASASGTGSAGSQSGTTSTGAHGGAGSTGSQGGSTGSQGGAGGMGAHGGSTSSQGGVGGTAGAGGCASGETSCSGACVDLAVDVDHCGSCGHACGQNAFCANGTCQCSAPFADCDVNPANGCEANLSSDLDNCGACGAQCILEPHIGQGCITGICVFELCDQGYAECNGNPADGCETDVATDPMNCGACGHACGQNAFCAGGTCQCVAPFADCDVNPANGCEANLSSGVDNCGACGISCPQALCGRACIDGICVFSQGCGQWFAHCDCNSPIGCETDVADDPMNCGFCGNVCAAGMQWVQGVCQ